jgi:hypothetical protein
MIIFDNQNQMSIKKNLLLTFSLFILLGIQCKKDEEIINQQQYTIKGKLLTACDSLIPVTDFNLFISSLGYWTITGLEVGPIITQVDGSFEFIYKHTKFTKSLLLSARGNTGYTYQNLILGIPVNQNIDIGNVYIKNNMYAVINIKTEKITSASDTLFYNLKDYRENIISNNYAVGPFIDNQQIDTIIFQSVQIYDNVTLDDEWLRWGKHNAYLQYSVGKNDSITTLSKVLKPCVMSDKFEVIIR